MALLAETYLNIFETQTKGFYGYRNTEIYQLQYFSPEKDLTPNCLYFAKSGTPAPEDPSICILLINQFELENVFHQAQSLLIQDYRRNSSVTLLNNAILQHKTPDEIVCIAHMIMENPVRFIDTSFRSIACSKEQMGNFQFSSLRSGIELDKNQIFLLEADETNPFRRLVGRSTVKGITVGYLLVEETETPFCPALDIRYLKLLLDLYASQIYQTQSVTDSEEIAFIRELLQGSLTDPTEIFCRLDQLRLPRNEKYYLMAVDRSTNYSPIVKEKLYSILKREIYVYDHYYLVLFDCEWNHLLKTTDFPELTEYLATNNLNAGLSYGFFEYSYFKTAFEQCVKTLAICKNKNRKLPLARYEDNMIAHLLELASSCGVPVLSFCHPTCIKIYEYDQKNGSNLLETLAAYILNGGNLQVASQLLYVHKNTVYHRIDTLKEKFKLNLNDPRMFTKLQISIRIFTYLNICDFTAYMGPDSEENDK